MSRFFRSFRVFFLVLAGLAGFGLVTSCNILGGSGTGNLTVLMTDAITDDWTEVSVHFLSASLRRQGTGTWEEIWTAPTADSGKVNLLDLSGVNDILSAGTLKEGTYDYLKLVLNTSTGPESMTLIDANGAQILPEDITIVDPSGAGEIKVELSPKLDIKAGENNLLSIDFDLAHPLSIVNLDGKVVISLKVRHKALPRDLTRIQFARTLGKITSATANADGTAAITITNLQDTPIDFIANPGTVYIDVTTGTAAPGTFDGLKALAGTETGAALVASNMNSNGDLFARRIWYSDDIAELPSFSPEGLVRRVGDNWLIIHGKKTEVVSASFHKCNWGGETVFVDEGTQWTFQGEPMGDETFVGTVGLQYLARGYRVEIVYDPEITTAKVADSINIQSAHHDGLITEPTVDDFKLGWFWWTSTMLYSDISGHEFGWWFYGLDYGTEPHGSADRQALIDMVAAAREARLWVFAYAGFTWDAATLQWVVEDLVIAPMKLHDYTRITEGYNAETGTLGVSTYSCWDKTTPENWTIKLDHEATDPLQTIVGLFIWRADTHVVTFTLPVLPDDWATVLVPTVDKVKIWVHPVKADDGSYSWHAYSVLAYRFVRE
jgi:hypothetical protein